MMMMKKILVSGLCGAERNREVCKLMLAISDLEGPLIIQ